MNKSQLLSQYKDLLLSSSQPDHVRIFDKSALDHLATVGARGRLEPLVVETVKKSVVENLVAPSRVGQALRVMETYAKNVYLMPWKKEFHVITTYSAVYKNDLEPALFTLPKLFDSLNYIFDAAEYVWRWAQDSQKLMYLEQALEFRLGALECQVLENIIRELYPLTVAPSLVYEFRTATIGDDKSTALALRHKLLQAKQGGDIKDNVNILGSVARDSIHDGLPGKNVKSGEKVKRIRFKDVEATPEVESPESRNSMEYLKSIEYQNMNKYLDFGASQFIDDAEDREELIFLPPKLSQGRYALDGLEERGLGLERLDERVICLNLRDEEGPKLPAKKSEIQRSPNKTTGNLIPDLIRSNYGQSTGHSHHYKTTKAPLPPPPPPPLSSFRHPRDQYSNDLITASNDLYSRHPDLEAMLNMSRNIGDLDIRPPCNLIFCARRDMDTKSRLDPDTTSRCDLDTSRTDLDMPSRRDLNTTRSDLDKARDNTNANKGILTVRNLTYAPSGVGSISTISSTTVIMPNIEAEKKTRFHVDL